MPKTTALEFQRKIGEYQHRARREPVEITRHGRRELVLMSAEHYDLLVAAAGRSHRTAEASPAIVAAEHGAELERQGEELLVEKLLAIGRDCAAHLKEPYRSVDHDGLLYDERGLPR